MESAIDAEQTAGRRRRADEGLAFRSEVAVGRMGIGRDRGGGGREAMEGDRREKPVNYPKRVKGVRQLGGLARAVLDDRGPKGSFLGSRSEARAVSVRPGCVD